MIVAAQEWENSTMSSAPRDDPKIPSLLLISS